MITDFSPYLDNGVLDLNKEGNKFSSGKGGIRCFEKIFDIGRLAEFIATPGVKGFKATLWGIDKMGIDNFRLLMDAIKKSPIILLNLENNPLTLEMVKEISELTELTELNLASCNIGDKEIIKIVKGLPKVLVLNVENNGITDKGVDAIVKYLPNLLSLNASCNCITDIGADKIKYFKELEELTIAYCNNVSCEKLEEIIMVHRETLTEVDIFSSSYPVQGVLKIARLLPLNCAVKLGPYWTRGVNKDEDAPFPLDGKVRPYIIVLANDPLPLVKVVEGDNNAPALVGVVGENNNALPPVEHVGVVGDILEGLVSRVI